MHQTVSLSTRFMKQTTLFENEKGDALINKCISFFYAQIEYAIRRGNVGLLILP